jgi:hypothetical protein|tara:strand:+ start:319 stop:564 length:246 start_codon:yes stop_codon:yes gene_type:complete
MRPRYIVYFIAAIVLCFAFRGFQIHNEMYQVFAQGYEANLPICDIKEKIEIKMKVLEGLLIQLTCLVVVLALCVSLKRHCH